MKEKEYKPKQYIKGLTAHEVNRISKVIRFKTIYYEKLRWDNDNVGYKIDRRVCAKVKNIVITPNQDEGCKITINTNVEPVDLHNDFYFLDTFGDKVR